MSTAFREVFVEPTVLASSFVDEDGRPLAEMNAPRSLRSGVEFELQPSRYAGSRFGRLQNVSALKQFRRRWEELLRDVRAYRNVFTARTGSRVLSVGDLWRLSRVLTSLPMFLTRRGDEPTDPKALPASVSLMFKAGQGVHMVLEHMVLESFEMLSAPTSAADIATRAEDGGFFISPDSGRACAGPPTMIDDFLGVLVDGADATIADGASPSFSDEALARHIVYGNEVTHIHAERILFEVEARLATEALLGEFEWDEASEPERTFAQETRQSLGRFGRFAEAPSPTLERVRDRMCAFLGLPAAEGVAPLQTTERHPALVALSVAPDRVDSADVVLHEFVTFEERWLARVTDRQRRVCECLRRPLPHESLSRDDFLGQGFSPTELLTTWLERHPTVSP